MRLLLPTSIGLVLGCLCSCSYLANRGTDLLDVVSLGVERGSFFASANVGPFRGLGYSYVDPTWGDFESKQNGWGVIGGCVGPYRYHKSTYWLVFNEEHARISGDRQKSYGLWSVSVWPAMYAGPHPPEDHGPLWLRYGELQINIGLFYGVRAGINLTEACDLLLGLATLDPAGDDMR